MNPTPWWRVLILSQIVRGPGKVTVLRVKRIYVAIDPPGNKNQKA